MMLLYSLMIRFSAHNRCNYRTFLKKCKSQYMPLLDSICLFQTSGRKTVPGSTWQDCTRLKAADEFYNFSFFFVDYSMVKLKKELYERTKFILSPCKLCPIFWMT